MTIEISPENFELLAKSLKLDKADYEKIVARHRTSLPEERYQSQILHARLALGMSNDWDAVTGG